MSQYSGMVKLTVARAQTVRTRGTSLAASPAMSTGRMTSPAASWMLLGAARLARPEVPLPPSSPPPSSADGSEKSPMSSPRQRAAAWRTRGCASRV